MPRNPSMHPLASSQGNETFLPGDSHFNLRIKNEIALLTEVFFEALHTLVIFMSEDMFLREAVWFCS